MKVLIWVSLLIICLAGAGAFWMLRESGTPGSGTNQPDAKQCFITSCKKTQETKGFHLKMTMDISAGRDKVTLDMKGKQENPDKMYLTGKMVAQRRAEEIELYAKGDKCATKMGGDGNWQLDSSTNSKAEMLPLKQMLRASQYIQDAKFIPDDIINGIQCKGVSVRLSDEGIIKLANLESFPYKDKMKIEEASYEMWFNPADSLPYRIAFKGKITVDAPGEGIMTLLIGIKLSLFDYDKNIKIVLPDEVSKLLGG